MFKSHCEVLLCQRLLTRLLTTTAVTNLPRLSIGRHDPRVSMRDTSKLVCIITYHSGDGQIQAACCHGLSHHRADPPERLILIIHSSGIRRHARNT
jgi:hypothetical protein